MAGFTISKHVNAPVAAAFAAYSDLANAAGRFKGITKLEILTPGPIGVGTRFKETRVMFGREHTEEMAVTAFDPDRSYEITGISCGAEMRTLFRFTPDAGGTRVDAEFQTRALTFFANLMKPMMWLMGGTLKKCIDQDMEDAKKNAEAAAVA